MLCFVAGTLHLIRKVRCFTCVAKCLPGTALVQTVWIVTHSAPCMWHIYRCICWTHLFFLCGCRENVNLVFICVHACSCSVCTQTCLKSWCLLLCIKLWLHLMWGRLKLWTLRSWNCGKVHSFLTGELHRMLIEVTNKM